MQRARKWLRSTVFRRAKIPPLPDEILVKIFECLAPEDRLPIRLVSRKFRNLELTIGNRAFGIISFIIVDRGSIQDAIVADFPSSRAYYAFDAEPNDDFEIQTPAIRKFLRGVVVSDRFTFLVGKGREPKASQSMLSLLSLITCKEVFIVLQCSTDFSDLVASIFNNIKHDQLKEVTLRWEIANRQNLTMLQEAIQLLPTVDLFAIHVEENGSETIKNDDPESFLLNGPFVLAVIGVAPRIYLYSIHCTAQDLLDAFKIACQSSMHKFVSLNVVQSATNNLLTVAEEQGFLTDERRVLDYTRGYAMFLVDASTKASGRCLQVVINPIDADGKFIRD